MTDLIVSLHPRWSRAIIAGSKSVEVRRVIPAQPFRRLLLYETAPTSRIVAAVEVSGSSVLRPAELWDEFGSRTGATRAEILAYLRGRRLALAIELGRVTPLDLALSDVGLRAAPQGWAYRRAPIAG